MHTPRCATIIKADDVPLPNAVGQVIVTTRGGKEKHLEAHHGFSVMEVIRGSGDDELLALCGGCCSCGTCHIYVEEAFHHIMPGIGDDENYLLDGLSHRNPNSRLACQIPFSRALDGLRVIVAPQD
jgi:ferredoxin, 2Fe-2S